MTSFVITYSRVISHERALRTDGSSRCIIVGADIIGAAVALEFSHQGRKVVVVDAASAPGIRSTAASSAIIRSPLHQTGMHHHRTQTTTSIGWRGPIPGP